MGRGKFRASSSRVSSKPADILRAASLLFREHGLSITTMDAIAAQADISKATLYKYFSTKHELFAAVVAEAGERHWVASLKGESPRRSMPAALMRVARAVVELLLSPETIASYRMVVAESARHPELGTAYYKGGAERLLKRLEQYFTAAIKNRELRRADPRRMAEHFVGLVRGDLQLRALLGVKDDFVEHHKQVVIRAGVDAFYRLYAPLGHPLPQSSGAVQQQPTI